MPTKYYYKWTTFEKDCTRLAQKVVLDMANDEFKPELVVGIARGGLFVAGMISQFLNSIPVETITIRSYEDMEQKDLKVLKEGSSEKPTLICDDVIDTGNTAKLAKEMYPNSRILVLHYKSKNSPVIKPDYYGSDRNEWIVYPWEVNEK